MKNAHQLANGCERMNNWHAYEQLKAKFIQQHPEATYDQITEFCRRIAEELDI